MSLLKAGWISDNYNRVAAAVVRTAAKLHPGALSAPAGASATEAPCSMVDDVGGVSLAGWPVQVQAAGRVDLELSASYPPCGKGNSLAGVDQTISGGAQNHRSDRLVTNKLQVRVELV
jgi:hypothetical protein